MSDKPKRQSASEFESSQDAVDLDALMRDYERQGMDRPQGAARLSEERNKRKNDQVDTEPEASAATANVRINVGGKEWHFNLNDVKDWKQLKDRWQDWKPSKRRRKDFEERLRHFLENPYAPDYTSEDTTSTSDERMWSAIGHAVLPLTTIAGIFTSGMTLPLVFFAPLILWFFFRNKSGFVSHHARQAAAAQAAATIGWGALITGVTLIGVVLSVVLALTIVGIVAIPFLWLGIGLFILASLIIPLGAFFYSILGTVAALSGKTFNYPYVGRWVK